MFKLRDFYHLAQLDPYFDRMIAEGAGMMVIAGIDSRPINALAGGSEEYLPGEVFLPSGLSGLFDILMQTMLVENPTAQAVVVAREKSLARVPRQLKRRIRLLPVDVGMLYDRQIANAFTFQPDLLVVDHLTLESAPAAFNAAINLSEEVLYLDRADGLVLFTDGLSDATDEQGRFFGGERLVQLLDSLVGQPAEKICEGVFQQLSAYRGQSDPFDDMTLLVMEVL